MGGENTATLPGGPEIPGGGWIMAHLLSPLVAQTGPRPSNVSARWESMNPARDEGGGRAYLLVVIGLPYIKPESFRPMYPFLRPRMALDVGLVQLTAFKTAVES